MSHLLKEALKTICAADHWSYAVFWKMGFQNPKLLIWEECYYESMQCSDLLHNSNNEKQHLTLEDLERCWVTPGTCSSQFGAQVEDKVQWLVNKMMLANQVHVMGEGLVGRAAFTGNHQWIVSGNYNGTGDPPEVVNEVHAQFSAGMQTVAVIPVTRFGVVQLGSSLAIMENIGFVHNVRDLILQTDCIPSSFLPDNFVTGESLDYIGMPISEMASVSLDPIGKLKEFTHSTNGLESFLDPGLVNHSTQSLFGVSGDSQQIAAPTFEVHDQNLSNFHGKGSCASMQTAVFHSNLSPKRHLRDELAWAGAGSFESNGILNQLQASLGRPGYGSNCGQLIGSNYGCNYVENPVVPDSCRRGNIDYSSVSCSSVMTSQLSANNTKYSDSSPSCKSSVTQFQFGERMRCKAAHISVKKEDKDLYEAVNMSSSLQSGDFVPDFNKIPGASQLSSCGNAVMEDISVQSSKGDDLFDILGMEFKSKITNGYTCNSKGTPGLDAMNQLNDESQDLSSFMNPYGHRMLESRNFSSSGSDLLLEAVFPGIHPASTQNSDDNVSCGTSLTRASTATAPNKSSEFGSINNLNQMCDFSGFSNPTPKSTEGGPTLVRSDFGKRGCDNGPQSSSLYESQINSWIEQGPVAKCQTSIATANSKKADLVGKSGRKRLKPGENPRPRPKDRQMIQDRVKELRDIIPNGAKCSIDSLLERTIKHMLFLQSITKHADKLKQMADSKIINKDGGLLLKDNFEGGATWAYEVGSQSMICPIVVEDLTPPRQFTVEMLYEEKGFFLEIADMIRGMGLVILKGMMEARNEKIWARFAVEANRDITRMELFISLVHLLERAAKDSVAAEDDRLVQPPGLDQGATVDKQQLQLLSTKSQVMC